MDVSFSVCLPRDEASVPLIRHLCRDALRSLAVRDECVWDVEVAITEACTNVLKHASVRDEQYEVTIEINEMACEIKVVDIGAGTHTFDHGSSGFEPAGLSAETGRGIHLMRALVDSLEFTSKPSEGGTVLHLVKLLDLTEDSILRRPSRI